MECVYSLILFKQVSVGGGGTATSGTAASEARTKATRLELDVRLTTGGGARRLHRLLHGYSAEQTMSDTRLVAEVALRQEGLLADAYAARQMLAVLQPPTRPRPDMFSQINWD